MAIREMKNEAYLKMNVVMKDGREFLGCDITLRPFGDSERIVSFWVDGAIRVVPLEDVRQVDLYSDADS
jgi:hypothetical protein